MEWLCMTALKKIFAGNLPVFHGTCVCPLLDLKEDIFTKKRMNCAKRAKHPTD